MVVDTSALIELLFGGPEKGAIRGALQDQSSGAQVISAASLVEAHVVVRRRHALPHSARMSALLDDLVTEYRFDIEPVTPAQARLAIEGFARYGKGTGGGALNFGDCFSYALAKERNDALLFVGEDFRRTDVRAAI
ncbi:MAG: type II toxin-antitoxin system VapC family toxin [Hyphomonadaceae bacterium]|nr:type II toxin-antitoxin system VapC family toxin [Hyphomonadaceae bacterium]